MRCRGGGGGGGGEGLEVRGGKGGHKVTLQRIMRTVRSNGYGIAFNEGNGNGNDK